MLTDAQKQRYARQTMLPDFGARRQELLLQSKVVIVGAGGLGCPIALYLAAAGVRSITIIDYDVVALSNLQRQVAFGTEQIGLAKASELVTVMTRIDASLSLLAIEEKLDEGNYESHFFNATLVIDGTDNFASRFLIADACHLLRIPYLQAAVFQFQAQIMLCVPGASPCYRCVFQEPPRNGLQACDEGGVLGTIVGTAGTMAATEAIKFLSKMSATLRGRMLVYDGLLQTVRNIELSFDADCNLCGSLAEIKGIERRATACETIEGRSDFEIPIEKAKQLLTQGGCLIDVREEDEFFDGHLPNAISMPLSSLDNGLETMRDIKIPAIVYCRSGQRSRLLLQRLEGLGIKGFYSLAGGMKSFWRVE